MTLAAWEDKYAVGIAAIDSQHRGLIDAMNNVHDAATSGADEREVLRTVDSLVALVQRHFAAEEAYMESIGFDGFEHHRAIHRMLQRQLDDHRNRFVATGTPDPKLFAFLRLWLETHICGADAEYSRVAAPVPALA